MRPLTLASAATVFYMEVCCHPHPPNARPSPSGDYDAFFSRQLSMSMCCVMSSVT